jgi:hypothetical protein
MKTPAIDKAGIDQVEAVPLVAEMHRALGEGVAVLEEHWSLSRPEAIAKLQNRDAAELERARTKPPSQLTYLDLYTLARHSPELSALRWEEAQKAARSELQTGHRAASVVEKPCAEPCQDRVRFLALRAELIESWQARNAVERLLIDSLAQAQTQYEYWLDTLTSRSILSSEGKVQGRWAAPRQTDAEAIEQAAAMVERFHRIMVRNIRTLQNLRRHSPVVLVQNAGQVNVGQQQINTLAG